MGCRTRRAALVMASAAMASTAAFAVAGCAPRTKWCPSRVIETPASRQARCTASTSRCRAAATSSFDVQDEEDEDDEDEARREPTPEELDTEARVLLQWPELSAQVRAFTATTLGYRSCDPVLPLGEDFEDSQRLLRETSATAELRETGRFPREVFEGTRDIRPWVLGATRGRVLSGASLADIATTANAANAIWNAIDGSTGDEKSMSSLTELALPLTRIDSTLEPEIARCIAVPGGNVKDDASEKLKTIRSERRETETTLRQLLLEKANYLARKNFAERAQVVSRLGRECIPMKSGAQSEMEGVVLGASGTGATVFKEPIEATPLNNRLMELGAEEELETERILKELTEKVLGSDNGVGLLKAVDALASIDMAAARAEHAKWLSAKAPEIFKVSEKETTNTVSLPGMQHPLLLQPRLPVLPRGGKVGEDEEVDGWDKLSTTGEEEDELLTQETETPRVENRSDAIDVVPVDFSPPNKTRLVAITGPNTGGKTASLKALGLALLMARAGLHLPTALNETAFVPWTSRVLADLGDAQNLDLDGGLSTFSAHLTRLRRILAAALDTNDSVVVLLDEPGGGTDPAEGAALATAVLRASANRAALTVATSHYEEVKALAGGVAVENDGTHQTKVDPFPGAANAAVEFNTATLRPTYRLLWGTSGASNALAVARGLGLEENLADAAERRWVRGRRSNAIDTSDANDTNADFAELAVALEKEREVQTVRARNASDALERAKGLHADVIQRGAARLGLRASMAVEAANTRGAAGVLIAKQALTEVKSKEDLDSVADSLMPDGWIIDMATGDAVPGRRRNKRPDSVDASVLQDEDGVSFDSFDSVDEDVFLPRVGSTVTVRRMGDAEAEVVDVDATAGEVVVRMGSITTRAPLTGVSPVVGKY